MTILTAAVLKYWLNLMTAIEYTVILIHRRGTFRAGSEMASIFNNQRPNCFIHMYQMTQATHIASKMRPIERQKFLIGVSLRTERVFLPETFSTK